MASFKIVMSRKDGKSYQREIKDAEAAAFKGLKLGDKIKGETIGLAGYEFQITGGSDKAGFPMRRDVDGTLRKRILAVSGVGLHKKRKGQKQRKTVAGNTIHDGISQINLKVLKEGKEKLGGEESEKKKEALKEEAPKEKKKEEKPAEKKEEKAVEKKEKKEAPKKEEKKPEEKPVEKK